MERISKELYDKLLLADSQEEVTAILKAGGREKIPAEEVWAQVQKRRAEDGMELSLDELEDVAGGGELRDWWEKGCAATVEPGSDCWGTDGGCDFVNITYINLPVTCPNCGRRSAILQIGKDCVGYHLCKYCGRVD